MRAGLDGARQCALAPTGIAWLMQKISSFPQSVLPARIPCAVLCRLIGAEGQRTVAVPAVAQFLMRCWCSARGTRAPKRYFPPIYYEQLLPLATQSSPLPHCCHTGLGVPWSPPSDEEACASSRFTQRVHSHRKSSVFFGEPQQAVAVKNKTKSDYSTV